MTIRILMTTLAMIAGIAAAQPGPHGDCRSGTGSPATDCGMHHDINNTSPMGAYPHPGEDKAHGWSFMTPKEQEQHREKIKTMKTYAECKSYMEKHHEVMMNRAKTKGQELPNQANFEVCEGLKPTKK